MNARRPARDGRDALARRLAQALALAGVAVLLCGAGLRLAGLRVNTSHSIPPGLYRVSSAPVTRGAYVLVCPPQTPIFALARQRGYLGAGFCPGGHGYLMKQVLAAKADQVRFSAHGVHVNGRLLDASAALPADQAGRPLPRYRPRRLTLGAGELLLMSPGRGSFDARYFGPLPLAQIESVIVPVLTWPTGCATQLCRRAPPGSGSHGIQHLRMRRWRWPGRVCKPRRFPPPQRRSD